MTNNAQTVEVEIQPDTSLDSKREVKLEILRHLSKEIELAHAAVIAQRTKNNLLAWGGPFLILSAAVTNAGMLKVLTKTSSIELSVICLAVLTFYTLMGYLSAAVEWHFIEECREFRTQFQKYADANSQSLFSTNHSLKKKWHRIVYLLIYGGTGGVFAVLIVLLCVSLKAGSVVSGGSPLSK